MSEFEKKIIELKKKLNNSKNLKELFSINAEIFGRNGIINSEFKKLGSIPLEQKKNLARSINKIKQELSDIYKAKIAKYQIEILLKKLKKKKLI